ncbi:MAG: response regulator, partial [bacterium]|nr:response regulator [bacterium]
KYEQKPLNINAVINETIKVSEKIFEKQILVNCDYCENVKTVNADINQLDQVFTNIFINAKDAMPSGGKIDIKTENAIVTENDLKIRPELASGEYVRITIADNGTGIPKEILNRIFEPFFTTKREGKGTGLGMASVYGIVKNHDGFIYCDSELGEGSTFTIYLPASNESITEEKTEYEVVLGDSTILVVDDEENVLDITSSSLESLGYVVLTAKSGDEAIEIYKREKENIDLIMLDMIMPGKTGKETYNELRKFNPDIRVIIASGYSQNGTASEILNDGALGFIQKPFRMDELSKVIAEALNK